VWVFEDSVGAMRRESDDRLACSSQHDAVSLNDITDILLRSGCSTLLADKHIGLFELDDACCVLT
jgi:hypothetical protein